MPLYLIFREFCFFSSLLIGINSLTDESGNDIHFKEHKDSVPLIIDVQQYLKASSVFLINTDDRRMQTWTVVQKLSLEFSEKGVFSVYLDLDTAIHRFDELNLNRILRPLFVALLNTPDEIVKFGNLLSTVSTESIWWLLIFSKSVRSFCTEPKWTQFELTFDTEMMVKCHSERNVREWYSFGNNITSGELATWDTVHGFKMIKPIDINKRRNDLSGLTFRMATVKKSPFISSEINGSDGFFNMILKELQNYLHFNYKILYHEDFFGTFDEKSKQWTGAIGRVARNEVDFGIAEFTMTKERLKVAKFTHPILLTPIYLYLREPKISPLKFSQYFEVFMIDTWICWAVVFFVSTMIVLSMKYKILSNFLFVNNASEDFLQIWGLFCQQGLPDFPKKTCLKLAYISIILQSAMMYYLYSASLFTYLANNVPVNPFQNTEELFRDGSHRVLVLQQSSDYDMIQGGQDKTMQNLKRLMANFEDLAPTTLQGFVKICETDKTIFYATRDIQYILNAWIPCRLFRIETGSFDSMSLIMSKRNQYKGIFDYQLRQFQIWGITSRIVDIFYKKKAEPPSQYTPVTIKSIMIILFILGAGIMLSLCILGLELALHRTLSRKSRVEITKEDVKIAKLVEESEAVLESLHKLMKKWQKVTEHRDGQVPP
ncbi:hypothetical protein QAD02_014786 [Eretmocerus hayati]|uniref:Uncharacterized protein n=1 Tax=Eretmocerus hayati TaxID=131215 RepID=A0ACC2P5Z1_9HYME|nr:hypothetical protein QAD02_014786 [Eretmocerus hayati]